MIKTNINFEYNDEKGYKYEDLLNMLINIIFGKREED